MHFPADFAVAQPIKFSRKPADERSKDTAKDAKKYFRGKVTAMTQQKAIRILMQSPFYFKLELVARKVLIKEFCALHNAS